MTFGQHIRKIRRNHGLNQTEFGNIFGVSQITICGWEKYGKVPDVAIIAQICKRFNVTFETLFEDYF